MKCQNCGNNEVNFRYSSNINGNVIEAHLCSECAGKLGYLNDETFSSEMPSFSGMMSGFFGGGLFGSFAPAFRMPMLRIPAFPQYCGLPVYQEPSSTDKSAESPQNAEPAQNMEPADIQAGDDIKKRREINMLREQMKKAAEAEDFEKAAQIRDDIKALEG